MKLRSLLLIMTLVLSTFVTFADNNYKVISTSRLNVRKSPSTTDIIIGKFQSGQEIEVISIQNGWAKVIFNNKIGYVSEKYIVPLYKKNNDPKTKVQTKKSPTVLEIINNTETYSNKKIGNKLSFLDNTDLYLSVQGGFGYSKYLWNNGKVNGTMSYSLDIIAQLYLKKEIGFIPENWYSELALGYDKKGAAKFDMSYVHAQIYPFGYKFDQTPMDLIVKGGMSLSYPLGDFGDRWNSDLQVGVICGAQIEWKQISIGCNIAYDFTEVSPDCGQKLNNLAILGTISYKLIKF